MVLRKASEIHTFLGKLALKKCEQHLTGYMVQNNTEKKILPIWFHITPECPFSAT